MLMDSDHQSSTDSTDICNNAPDNQCFGWGCTETATHVLLISLINRIGYFCEKCKIELERSDLIKYELSQNQFSLLNEKLTNLLVLK